jgi:hypothetical protein
MLGEGALQHRKGILQDSAARYSAISFCAHKYNEGPHGQFEAEGKAKKVEVRSDCVHPFKVLKADLSQPPCLLRHSNKSTRQTKVTFYRRKKGGLLVRLPVMVMAMGSMAPSSCSGI